MGSLFGPPCISPRLCNRQVCAAQIVWGGKIIKTVLCSCVPQLCTRTCSHVWADLKLVDNCWFGLGVVSYKCLFVIVACLFVLWLLFVYVHVVNCLWHICLSIPVQLISGNDLFLTWSVMPTCTLIPAHSCYTEVTLKVSDCDVSP